MRALVLRKSIYDALACRHESPGLLNGSILSGYNSYCATIKLDLLEFWTRIKERLDVTAIPTLAALWPFKGHSAPPAKDDPCASFEFCEKALGFTNLLRVYTGKSCTSLGPVDPLPWGP